MLNSINISHKKQFCTFTVITLSKNTLCQSTCQAPVTTMNNLSTLSVIVLTLTVNSTFFTAITM